MCALWFWPITSAGTRTHAWLQAQIAWSLVHQVAGLSCNETDETGQGQTEVVFFVFF